MAAMTLFDLSATRKGQRFQDFIHGDDMAEAVAAARKAAAGDESAYIWGKPGSGKTHLANAARVEAVADGIDVATPGDRIDGGKRTLVLVDDAGGLDLDGQEWLFKALRAVLQGDGDAQILATGDGAASGLVLRHDVRSRLQELPGYHLSVLSDSELVEALVAHAARLGRPLPTAVARELVNLLPRDMANLAAACEELDSHAIANNLELTAKTAREWVRGAGEED